MHNQYYGNYDKNIISVKGGGKITQNKPANRSSRQGVISSEFKNGVNYMPPLEKITIRGDKLENNGYVNPNNFVEEDNNSHNYYYTSQQMNQVNIIPKLEAEGNEGKILNLENPIEHPPPLVTSKPNLKNEEIIKEKIKQKIKE